MTRLIKKYKNRRLYDTEISQYITIDTLYHYVIEEIPFRVEDSSTKEDLTNLTLLQVIIEMEERAGVTQFLSTDMLKQLILFSNHPLSQSMKKMTEQFFTSMATFSKTGSPFGMNNWQDHIKQWMKGF